ncbi:hypothetical protein HY333_01855 [Candidatus Collierbacteria bacterium]|nr:hypothetical protein [Candidatus Collierbacteria bacterium]
MENSKGREIHQLALAKQEAGEFLEALKLEMEAMVAYQEAGDLDGFAEIFAMLRLTINHLREKTGFGPYLILAKHFAMASVEMAKTHGQPGEDAIPLFNLAKTQLDLGETTEAVASFKAAVTALEAQPGNRHYRQSVLADMRNYLAVAEYKAGDQTALTRAEGAIAELEGTTDASNYEKGVWMSGGYMRMAEAIGPSDMSRARELMARAKQIIDADPNLKLRRDQWRELAERLGV